MARIDRSSQQQSLAQWAVSNARDNVFGQLAGLSGGIGQGITTGAALQLQAQQAMTRAAYDAMTYGTGTAYVSPMDFIAEAAPVPKGMMAVKDCKKCPGHGAPNHAGFRLCLFHRIKKEVLEWTEGVLDNE